MNKKNITLEDIFNSIAKKDRILDLGCGSGKKIPFLEKFSKFLIGIDIDKEALLEARNNYSNNHFILGDANHTPFSSNTFNIIFANFSLHHINNFEETINESIRILKKGGKLVIIDHGSGEWIEMMNILAPITGKTEKSIKVKKFWNRIFGCIKKNNLTFEEYFIKSPKIFESLKDSEGYFRKKFSNHPNLHLIIKTGNDFLKNKIRNNKVQINRINRCLVISK